ncbi:MAG: hypothetical protein GYA42_03215, partial [Syntrophomonadaceae bacterium]|nr:hypothetical protein [Syntrophomonadaceae bacterium]
LETILMLLLPAALLAYFLKTIPPSVKDYRLIRILLLAGTASFYGGLLFMGSNPGVQSILKLAGACAFFTGVAFYNMRRPNQEANTGAPSSDERPGNDNRS